MGTFYIKRKNTLNTIRAQFQDATLTPVDITGSTVQFIMRIPQGRIVVIAPAVVDTAAIGLVHYDWVSPDTDIPYVFNAEFLETKASGKTRSFPNWEYITVSNMQDLGPP